MVNNASDPGPAGADLGAGLRALLDGAGSVVAAMAAGSTGGEGFVGGPQGWLRPPAASGTGTGSARPGETGPGSPPGAGSAGTHAAGTHSVSTCGVCPICLGLAALARSHPDALVHLSDAAESVLAAVAAMARPPAQPTAERSSPAADSAEATDAAAAPREERIDVSD